MRSWMFHILVFILLIAAPGPAAASSLPEDDHGGVILAYYRVGDDNNPDSNLPTDQFLSQVEEISAGGYNVIGLPGMVQAFETKQVLPPRTLAITFQGAYKSALQNAIPVLLQKKIPFTVFYSGAQAGADSNDMMNWRDLRSLSRYDTVTLGVLPDSYERLAEAGETAIKRQINNAILKYRENFSASPQFFAYPYGEFSGPFKSIVKASGFKAALGLQSGAASLESDFFALPRFTMTGSYGDLERFHLVTAALPLPVFDRQPADSFLTDKSQIGFSVAPLLTKDLSNLNCFVSGEEKPELEIIGNRVELRTSQNPGEERMRINCTLPSGLETEDGHPRWRWLGLLLANKKADQ